MKARKKLAAIGECMLEISNAGVLSRDARCFPASIGFGGDTLNSLIYASRLGIDCFYFTALGDDVYSDWLMSAWQHEGLHTQHVLRIENKLPGLYAIELNKDGERQFHYWRDGSAASEYINAVDKELLYQQLCEMDLIYLSGISLGILSDPQKDALIALIERLAKAGKTIAFDGNYRARNWQSREQAQFYLHRILRHVHWYLPTLEDETLLFDSQNADAVAAHYADYDLQELIIKDGANGCYLSISGSTEQLLNVPVPHQVTPVDTTAAGDSFNAAYLANRMHGAPPQRAALAGHALASKVLQCRGAIISKSDMP